MCLLPTTSLPFPFYKRENGGQTWISDLPKITLLVNIRVGGQPRKSDCVSGDDGLEVYVEHGSGEVNSALRYGSRAQKLSSGEVGNWNLSYMASIC